MTILWGPDSFTRADSTGLGAGYTDVRNGFDVASNKCVARIADLNNTQASGMSTATDMYCKAMLGGYTSVVDVYLGPCARLDASGNGYTVFASSNEAGYRLSKVVAGANVDLLTGALTIADGDTLEIRTVGSTVSWWLNGTQVTSTTDSTYVSGKAGTFAYLNHGTLDNLEAGDFNVAVSAIAIPSSSFHPGRSPGYAPQSARFYQPPRASNATIASPDVTLSLTGQAASFAAGTLSPSTSVALLGKAAAFAAGAVTPAIAVTLSGQSANFASGTLLPATSVALLGQSATFTAGTLSAAGDVTLSLTGQAATFSAGTLASATTVALNGQSAAFSAGNLIATPMLGLTGTSASFAQGALAPQTTVALSGQGATFSSGTLQPPGDVTVALTGAAAVFAAGTIIASGGDTLRAAGSGAASRSLRDLETAFTRSTEEFANPEIHRAERSRPVLKAETLFDSIRDTPEPEKHYDAEITAILWMLM